MRYVFLCLLLSLSSSPSWGQRFIPLTEPNAAAYAVTPSTSHQHKPLLDHTPTAAPVQPSAKSRKQTQRLLDMQADKQRPGRAIPMLGATTNRSWDRYLESFTHPIPERFDERVISERP